MLELLFDGLHTFLQHVAVFICVCGVGSVRGFQNWLEISYFVERRKEKGMIHVPCMSFGVIAIILEGGRGTKYCSYVL